MLVYNLLILAAKGETKRFMVRYHQSERIYCYMRLATIGFLRPLIIVVIERVMNVGVRLPSKDVYVY